MKVHVLLVSAFILYSQSTFSMVRVIVESVSNMTNQAIKFKPGNKYVVLESNKTYQNALIYDLEEKHYATLRFKKNNDVEAQFEAGLELDKAGLYSQFVANLATRINDKGKVVVAEEREYGNSQKLIQDYEEWIFYVKIVLSGDQFENSHVYLRREVLQRR